MHFSFSVSPSHSSILVFVFFFLLLLHFFFFFFCLPFLLSFIRVSLLDMKCADPNLYAIFLAVRDQDPGIRATAIQHKAMGDVELPWRGTTPKLPQVLSFLIEDGHTTVAIPIADKDITAALIDGNVRGLAE